MTIAAKDFWNQFLDLLEKDEPGGRTSSADYYVNNKAQPGEWGNVITQLFNRTKPGSAERKAAVKLLNDAGFWKGSDDQQFWVNQDMNSMDIQDLVNAAEERFPTMFNANASGSGNPGATPPAGAATNPDGSAKVPGVLSGGKFTKITQPGQPPKWGLTYVTNGIEHVYTFDSWEAAEAALGPNPVVTLELPWDTVNDGNTWLLGDAAAFSGQQGSYQSYWSNVVEEAGLEAGIRNPGKLGEYLSQPEILQIIAMGAAGGWSQQRIQAEIRNTKYYQETLYPGIKKILDSGVSNPEGVWWAYQDSVEGSLEALGYERDEDGTYGSKVGELLNQGINAEAIREFAPVFVRARDSADYAAVLNKWVEQGLGTSMDFEDWFDVLEGNTTPEMREVIERASIQWSAEQTKVLLDDETITRLASETELSEAQMMSALTQGQQWLLAVGNENLSRFGLSQAALVNAAFGIGTNMSGATQTAGTTTAVEGDDSVPPVEGEEEPAESATDIDPDEVSALEIQRRAAKAATELGMQDDYKAQLYVGFDESGRPQRGGLSALAPRTG